MAQYLNKLLQETVIINHRGLKVLSSVFFVLSSLLLFFLFQIGIKPIINGTLLFWLLIISLYLIIFVQILIIKFSKQQELILLIELIVLNLSLHGIYQIPYSIFYGTDAHFDMESLQCLLSNSHVCFESSSSTAPWPIIHIFGSFIFYLVGLDLFSTVKIVPFLIELSLPVILYFFYTKLIFNDKNKEKISLLSVLFFLTISNHIEFSSSFIRQTIAIPLIVLVLYFYYTTSYAKRNIVSVFLSIILVFELVMAHHFSSFMFLVLCFTLFFYDKISHSDHKLKKYFVGITAILVFSYWIYVASLPLMSIAAVIHNLVSPHDPTYSEMAKINPLNIATLRGYIIFYGFFLFNAFFSIILLLKYNKIKPMYGFVLFLFLCGFTGFIGLFFSSIAIFPDRLISFGWLFASLPLIITIYKLNQILLKQVSFIVLFLFFIFNIYQIPTEFYSNPSQVLVQPSKEDYSMALHINISKNPSRFKILAYQNNRMTLFDLYKFFPDSLFPEDMTNFKNRINGDQYYYDYFIQNKKLIKSINENERLSVYYSKYLNYSDWIKENDNYLKISDSNNLESFIKRDS